MAGTTVQGSSARQRNCIPQKMDTKLDEWVWIVQNFFLDNYGVNPPNINGDQMSLHRNESLSQTNLFLQATIPTWRKIATSLVNVLRFSHNYVAILAWHLRLDLFSKGKRLVQTFIHLRVLTLTWLQTDPMV